MLLDDGLLRYIGDPEEAGRQYLRMNFAKQRAIADGGSEIAIMTDFLTRVTDTWLENERGERIENMEVGEPIRLRAVVEARQDLSNPGFTLQTRNDDGVIFEVSTAADHHEEGIVMTAGSRATINATIENPLVPGRYAIVCYVGVVRNEQEVAQQSAQAPRLRRLRHGDPERHRLGSGRGRRQSRSDRAGREVRR